MLTTEVGPLIAFAPSFIWSRRPCADRHIVTLSIEKQLQLQLVAINSQFTVQQAARGRLTTVYFGPRWT